MVVLFFLVTVGTLIAFYGARYFNMSMDKTIEKKKLTAKRLARYMVAGVLLAAAVWVFILRSGGASLDVDSRRLTICTVKKGAFEEYIPAVGNVLPRETVYLDAVEGGRVETVFAEPGAMVKQGDKILKLSNPDLQLTLLNNEVQIYRARNELRLARMELEKNRLALDEKQMDADLNITTVKKKLDRYAVLYKEGIVSRSDYEQIKDEYGYWVKKQTLSKESGKTDIKFRQEQLKHQETSFNQMKKHITLIRGQNDRLTVLAPVSGHLTSLTAEKGESIPRGKRLGQIDRMDGYKVESEIDEHYLARIHTGLTGTCQLAGQHYSLAIKKIYPEVNEGKFRIDLEFNGSAPANIKRGQTLRIRLRLGDSSQAVLLPRGGFFQHSGGRYVFLLDRSGKTALRRAVRLGKQNPEVFEVLEGLKPGDRVITSSYEPYQKMQRLNLR